LIPLSSLVFQGASFFARHSWPLRPNIRVQHPVFQELEAKSVGKDATISFEAFGWSGGSAGPMVWTHPGG